MREKIRGREEAMNIRFEEERKRRSNEDIACGREETGETIRGRDQAIKIWADEEKEKKKQERHCTRKRRNEGNN